MKTQVIHLESNESLTSILDRISWTKAPRILLVPSGDFQLGWFDLDLVRLKRKSKAVGADVAVVTRNGHLRNLCRIHGIPVFPDLINAQRAEWITRRDDPVDLPRHRSSENHLSPARRIRKEKGKSISAGYRIMLFSIGLIGAFIIPIIFFPAASIEIHPRTNDWVKSISFRASTDASQSDIPGLIRAEEQNTTITGSDSVLVTGIASFPSGIASGSVLIENLTESIIIIPDKTLLRTPGNDEVRYVTLEEGILPAGVGEQVTVLVAATEAGSTGNAEPGSLTIMDDELGPSVSVTNPLPISGGEETSYPSATSTDRQNLYTDLVASLREACEQEILAALPVEAFRVTGSFEANVIHEVYFPDEGQKGDILSLTLEMECSTYSVDRTELYTYVKQILDEEYHGQWLPIGDPVVLDEGDFKRGDGFLEWTMTIEWSTRVSIHADSIVYDLLGMDLRAASTYIVDTYDLIKPPEISLKPAWWRWMPIMPFRITLAGSD